MLATIWRLMRNAASMRSRSGIKRSCVEIAYVCIVSASWTSGWAPCWFASAQRLAAAIASLCVGVTAHALKDEKAFPGVPCAPPAGAKEAITRIGAPHCSRIDVGVMPCTRPAVISDCISLFDKE